MQVSSLPRSSLALPASRFPRMSLTPTHHHHPSASTRIPARVFPYNLKFLHPTRHLTPPALSIRARFDSASNRASSKSLMEDDAELSDWVSELRMTPAFTDGRDGPEGRPKKRGRDASLPSINSNGFRDRDMNMNTVGSKGSNFEHRSRGRGRGANHLIRGSGSRSFQSEFEQDGDKLGMHTRGGAVRGGMRGRRNFGSRGGGRVMGNTDKQKGGVASSRIEKTVSGFMDLIGEQTSDVDGETQEIEVTNRTSLFRREDNEESISRSPEGTGSYLTETSFDQFDVSHSSLRAIKDAGYVKMTVVQEATLPFILKGKDVMAKAKTGTGKTVAFMLPSIEVVVKSSSSDPNTRRPPILVLVICPTRELANQAAAEANTLLKYHPSIGVQVVIGGTNLSAEQKHMKANPCQILVATPGRLKDHIENTTGFATRLMGLKVLVLDEADHLLDMGFRKDIEKIISSVPKQRQTLLFSATVPEEVQQVSHIALKRDHEFINTVQEGAEDTHSQVRQMHLVAPMENHFPLLYIILKEHISDDVNYKVIVFCTTAMVTKLVAETLGELNLNVREIHSRKTQSYRTRVSDEFRKSKGLILVTSDVSARGVDYPDVSLVIQLGVPADREQYIHRLGRTGRKGKEGHGILLLAPWEQFFLSSIKDLPITKAPSPTVDPDAKRKVERALSNVEMKSKELAYQAWLGYYNSNKNVGKDKARLVELGNEFSRCMGLNDPPAIPKVVIGKMGLKNVPGLRSK